MDGVTRRAFCALATAYANAASDGAPSRPPRAAESTTAAQADGGETVVSTAAELEAAFDELTGGETIRISGANAPYRTTRWLDIDADGVTVVGPGVRRLIAPADGANVGGIRIGEHERCHEIDLHGIGYHGNPEGQSGDATRLHGIAVRDATNVTIRGCLVRRTHPVAHGDGGSGISVTRRCSDVRIFDTKIDRFGDRGVQLGGERHMVYGNVITNGLDRPIACDVWPTDAANQLASSVSILGNLLGNSVEGSLVGIAHNNDRPTDGGYVNVVGNVGFGSHKSFCHVRGPEPLRNISIQTNVSTQDAAGLETEETSNFAGVSVSVVGGRNLAIKNNELNGYSGHGIHVDSDVSNIAIRGNGIADPGLAGIRLVDVEDATVDDNLVARAREAGIRLRASSRVAVRGNSIRGVGGPGIVTSDAATPAGHHVADNYLARTDEGPGEPRPAILLRDAGVRVRGNTIRGHDAPAIAERGDAAEGNVYEANWADGDDPWRIERPTSRVRDHVPPIDVHRDVAASSGVVRVAFDRPYARRPRIAFGGAGSAVQGVSFVQDDDGSYVGAEIRVDGEETRLDLAVNEL